jgi:ABC-2 type transport system ATP-binding protein
VPPVIRLERLAKAYGSVRALRDATVEMPGGAMGLLGPNGAGKTTLLKVLLGLLRADAGRATVLELDAARRPLELRTKVGYMPEADCYIPRLKGVRLVSFTGELSGLPRREALTRAHEVLHYVGLEEVRYRKVEEYSQGMRQRLRLAQALVHDPDLLFLDEPTSGLDPSGRKEMLALIRDLTERIGKHVVLSSHVLPDVEAICGFVVVLDAGRIASAGPMADLKGVQSGQYDARVVGDLEAVERNLRESGLVPDRIAADRISVALPEGTRPLFAAALAAGAQIRELREVAPTLEEALLAILGNQGGEG